MSTIPKSFLPTKTSHLDLPTAEEECGVPPQHESDVHVVRNRVAGDELGITMLPTDGFSEWRVIGEPLGDFHASGPLKVKVDVPIRGKAVIENGADLRAGDVKNLSVWAADANVRSAQKVDLLGGTVKVRSAGEIKKANVTSTAGLDATLDASKSTVGKLETGPDALSMVYDVRNPTGEGEVLVLKDLPEGGD